MVSDTDAVVDPGAVVVHFHNTSHTDAEERGRGRRKKEGGRRKKKGVSIPLRIPLLVTATCLCI